jgi:hypothetical protein
VRYFLLDGGHKSAAAALSHQLIPSLILESDSDFKKARKLAELVIEGREPQVIISSDLPRALHHTIAKYFPQCLEDKALADLVANTPSNLSHDDGVIDQKVQRRWINYALDLGIIPTPLLRAQFYGFMELLPEKGLKRTLDIIRKSMEGRSEREIEKVVAEYEKRIENYFSIQWGIESRHRARFSREELERALEMRDDPTFTLKDSMGFQLTENRLNRNARVVRFFEIFGPQSEIYDLIMGRIFAVTSHSGTEEAIIEHLDRYKHPQTLLIQKFPKGMSRGEAFTAMLEDRRDVIGKDIVFFYRNDPKLLAAAIEESRGVLNELRKNSPDERVKKGKGIMPTETYSLTRREGSREDEKKHYEMDEIVREVYANSGALLVLANCGLGKTTFAGDLVQRLMDANPGELGLPKHGQYVPILIKLRNLRSEANQRPESKNDESNEMPESQKDEARIRSAATGGLSDLDDSMLEAYKVSGKRFVFVLDGYDEIDTTLKSTSSFGRLVSDLSRYGKVIVTSRYEQFSEHENGNAHLGFSRTLNIDPDGILKHLDEYLETRLESHEDAMKLADYIKKQNPDIRDNWLMVYFIVNLYTRSENKLDLSQPAPESRIRSEGLDWLMWDHACARDIRLKPQGGSYSAQTEQDRMNDYLGNGTTGRKADNQKMAAYMLVNDLPSVPLTITPEERNKGFFPAEEVPKGWSLLTELARRKEIDARKNTGG